MENGKSPVMSGRQGLLYRALSDQDARLGLYYLAALHVLHREEIPDRFALAAHDLRELMEKLPRYKYLPLDGKPLSLKQQVRSIHRRWKGALGKSRCRTDSGWQGKIDEPLRSFLAKAEVFFGWVDVERPTQEEQTKRLVRKMDPIDRPLPGAIEGLRVKEWNKCHDYFEGACHHNFNPQDQEFHSWVGALEDFLLDRLCPRTFEDHANLDEIIREGNESGQQ